MSELGICVEVVVVREQGCEMTLTIKFGREKLAVELSTATQSLADLRKAIAEKTHLPPNSFKLIHAGAVMKDDGASRMFLCSKSLGSFHGFTTLIQYLPTNYTTSRQSS